MFSNLLVIQTTPHRTGLKEKNKMSKMFLGIVIGILGTVAVLKLPDLSSQMLHALWNLLTGIYVYIKTTIG